jgi:hypothetical protein
MHRGGERNITLKDLFDQYFLFTAAYQTNP